MKIVIFILLSLFTQLSHAASQIETIQLNHQLAADILPEVQALLPKSATASAFNEFIILRADRNTISKIKKLIKTLDSPIQRLKISLLNTDEHLVDDTENHVAVDVSSSSAQVSASRWSTSSVRNKQHSYQAQGIAGKPITILLGQEIPHQEQSLRFSPNGDVSIDNKITYIKLDNGFQAVARILPNHHVVVDIHPRFSKINPRNGVIDRSKIITRVSGSEGAWLEIGQIDNEKNIEKQGSTSYHSHRQHQQTLYIKVEQL